MAGSELQKAIDKLVAKGPGWKEFLPKQASPKPDTAGRAANALPKAGSGGNLTEPSFAARTYHARRTIKSTDGVLTWQYDPIKTISMVDPSGTTVVLTFAEPPN